MNDAGGAHGYYSGVILFTMWRKQQQRTATTPAAVKQRGGTAPPAQRSPQPHVHILCYANRKQEGKPRLSQPTNHHLSQAWCSDIVSLAAERSL